MKYILSIRLLILLLLAPWAVILSAQTGKQIAPTILYSGMPRQYEIGGINVNGVDNYDPDIIIGLSGLNVGDVVEVPGDDITNAVKRYWKHGLFSDVSIVADSIVEGKIYLGINLKQRPRASQINVNGVKKKEREDIQAKIGLIKGNQVTPNMLDRARQVIRKYYDEKGYKNAEIEIVQRADVNMPSHVIIDVNIDRKDKIKVHRITIEGAEKISQKKIKKLMKKTREKGKLGNFLKSKKYTDERFEEDKQRILDKYSELGYRDALIVKDSVSRYDENSVDVYLKIEEGNKYYLRNVNWVGNSVFSTAALSEALQLKAGDVYNQKLLDERLMTDETSIHKEYYNKGYVWSRPVPVELSVENDSIDLEIRITEGPQATINKVTIAGNDRLYEEVIRRELRTLPGALFSMRDLERSFREIGQMGHFDPEKINPRVVDDPQNATVDINWELVSKSNDQVELSAGWGQTGIIGKVALKFTNFSMRNLFSKEANRRGIIPQGDGQTVTLSAQSNGRYYQAYSLSFYDPWFGRKRPNSLSVSAFLSMQTDVADSYYNSSYYNNYYNYLYGYGNYNNYGYNNVSSYYDPDKYIKMYGVSVGWGRRLSWPDDYFQFSTELTYQVYSLKDWQYFIISNGKCNNVNLTLSLSRNSVFNPIYPRSGSEFVLSGSFTPPYSFFDGKDYDKLASDAKSPTYQKELSEKYKWIEYYKFKFKSKTYTSLTNGNYNLVLMTRADFGILGSYTASKKSPFETFYVGGDGMSGYSYNYATDIVALRGYDNGSLTPYGYEGYAYTRLGFELRYPLMLQTATNIYALAFVEGGNSWTEVKKFNPFDLKRSAGVGIRLFLQMIGMIGVDWAYGFDKIYGSSSYGGSQFHFILGQEF